MILRKMCKVDGHPNLVATPRLKFSTKIHILSLIMFQATFASIQKVLQEIRII